MLRAMRYVDRFIRNRGEAIEQVKRGEGLGRFMLSALAMYILFAAVYGFVMGSFRWANPLLFFSDFEIEAAPGPTYGRIKEMDPETGTVTTSDFRAAAELVGKEVRFNVTAPTPPYKITGVKQSGEVCRLTVEGPPMVARQPWKFAVFSALKVPALFLVTLLVCLPGLYVLNVAVGWGLRFLPTLAVLLFGIAGTSVMLIVLVPIVLFFTVLTDHYHFMKVLNVLIFAVAGGYGLQTLIMGLRGQRGEREDRPSLARLLFVWIVFYMFVGCQMAWSLRPFIGTPYLAEFAFIRKGSSNFYVNVLGSVGELGDTRR